MPKKKTARRKPAKKKKTTKRPASKAAVRTRKAAPRRKSAGRKRTGTSRRTGRAQGEAEPIRFRRSGRATETAGQSGDIEGLSRTARADSESVEELAEEGQSFEADAVDGVQQAEDEEESEVTTREVPEDDVPGEYDDEH